MKWDLQTFAILLVALLVFKILDVLLLDKLIGGMLNLDEEYLDED